MQRKIKILFICHGNICRSTMAEFVFKDMLEKAGLAENVYVASAATSTEEIGNPVHYGTARILDRLGSDYSKKRARQMTKNDYAEYDYLIGMDDANIRNMTRICGGDPAGKIFKLLSFAGEERDIADPWYTGRFETTYNDVKEGCEALLRVVCGNSGGWD